MVHISYEEGIFPLTPKNLLRTADVLINHGSHRPLDTDMRRAVSSMYYAMFHTLAQDAANLLVGKLRTTSTRSAWQQTCRALEHNRVKNINRSVLNKFPTGIQNFMKKLKIFKKSDIPRITIHFMRRYPSHLPISN